MLLVLDLVSLPTGDVVRMSGAHSSRPRLGKADQSWALTVVRAGQIRHTLANNVRRERERAGLSQEALADACELRRGAIARIEKAEREPRVSTLVACSIAAIKRNTPKSSYLHPIGYLTPKTSCR
jgi:DNA-binding XRE family transcriptional regulator